MREAKFFDISHGTKTIAAHQADVVLKIKLDRNEVGFLTHLGNSWVADTLYEIYVDGQMYLKLERVLGEVEAPHKFEPPIVFSNQIVFFGRNENSAAHSFEVVVDGLIYNDR